MVTVHIWGLSGPMDAGCIHEEVSLADFLSSFIISDCKHLQ